MQTSKSSPKLDSPQKPLSNYLITKLHRQDGPTSINNKSRNGVLIVVHKDIPTEDTSTSDLKYRTLLTIEIKFKLTAGAAYFPSKNKPFRSGRHRTVTKTRTPHYRR